MFSVYHIMKSLSLFFVDFHSSSLFCPDNRMIKVNGTREPLEFKSYQWFGATVRTHKGKVVVSDAQEPNPFKDHLQSSSCWTHASVRSWMWWEYSCPSMGLILFNSTALVFHSWMHECQNQSFIHECMGVLLCGNVLIGNVALSRYWGGFGKCWFEVDHARWRTADVWKK